MNRINQKFEAKKDILSIYFTAGYPELNDTNRILEELEAHGCDMVEVGMPYSDPLADGPVIQASSTQALSNGMSIAKLFDQLKDIRQSVSMPLVLMGYLNPVLQYGMEAFLDQCVAVGIDGLIIPDLPIFEYETYYAEMFNSRGLSNVFLITPQTTEARIRKIDDLSTGFIYMVSSYSTTGTDVDFQKQEDYYQRINDMQLKNKTVIGFGIRDAGTFRSACSHADGGIIGSAFVKHIGAGKPVGDFLSSVLNG